MHLRPVHYQADLKHASLSIIAEIMLDEFFKTVDDLSSDTDVQVTH